ncbi:hypothetical protein [Actinomadura madurae]|uniref:hypothetical protein n=1 Tax=Actinomadura madurae TaxID=1993 RepID=UPI0020D21D9B|nr:hypothetical protein [Actinomadura madurae]MCQ0021026.1 hypothetical protein [Actinomadura madurae]
MERLVRAEPILAYLGPGDGAADPLERVVLGDDLRLPGDVAVRDRFADREGLDGDARVGELGEVVDRDVDDAESQLRLRGGQALLDEPRQDFPQYSAADVVTGAELGEAEL